MNDFSAIRIFIAIALVTTSCALFTSLPGCGGSSPSSDVGPISDSVGSVPTSSLVAAEQLMPQAQVVCADKTACPEGVGMVIAATPTGVSRCTGALVAPDLVMTSSQCVPKDLLHGTLGAACGERVRFVLPALKSGAVPSQEARCSQVLHPSASTSDPTYAWIRLAAPVTGRRPMETDSSGLKDQDDFSVAVVDPTSDVLPLGEIRMQSCQAFQKSAVLPKFRADLTPTAALGGCRAAVTHLGAPVLDSRGKVRAMVQGGLSAAQVKDLQKTYSALLESGSQVLDFTFASNLACIQAPDQPNRALSSDCLKNSKTTSLTPSLNDESLDEIHSELISRSARWQSSPQQKFQWTTPLPVLKPTQVVSPRPICFTKNPQWLNDYHHWYRRGGYGSEGDIDLQVPHYKVDYSMTAALQTRYSIQGPSQTWIRIHFNPKVFAQTGQSSVTLTAADGSAIGGAFVMKTCGN